MLLYFLYDYSDMVTQAADGGHCYIIVLTASGSVSFLVPGEDQTTFARLLGRRGATTMIAAGIRLLNRLALRVIRLSGAICPKHHISPHCEITTSCRGLSPGLLVRVFSTLRTTSRPSITLPKTTCLLFRNGVGTVVIKNWQPFVFSPEFWESLDAWSAYFVARTYSHTEQTRLIMGARKILVVELLGAVDGCRASAVTIEEVTALYHELFDLVIVSAESAAISYMSTYDAMELAAFVALRSTLGVLRLAGAELAKILRCLGSCVCE